MELEDEVEFVDEQLQDEYKCPVCQEVFEARKDPHINRSALQHKCCGKHVCHGCYERLLTFPEPSCPNCRNPDFEAIEDKYFQRMVNNAQVYCCNKSKGCNWRGELNDYRNKHMNNCPKLARKCNHCTEIVPCQSRQTHLSTCEGVLIDCPNMCKESKVQRKNMQNHLENECLHQISNLPQCNVRPLIIPFVATITKISNIIDLNKSWSSPSFYTHEKGYKMIAHVSIQKKGFLSVSLQLAKGEYDGTLQWPIAATIDIEIYDWEKNKNFVSTLSLTGDAFCQQIRDLESSSFANGNHEFISLKSLVQSEFLKFDSVSLILKGFHLHRLPILQLPNWMKNCVSSFVVTSCTALMTNEYDFYGPPFYTSSNGYKLCVKVCLAGKGKGRGTHVSLFAHLMPGQNDKNLSWPFHADLKVSLLNWSNNVNHIEKTISFSNACDDHVTRRAKNSTDVLFNGCGLENFCQQSFLKPQSVNLASNMQFLIEDTLLIKIDSVVVYSSPPQPKAPICDGKYTFPFEFVVTEFSKRQKHSTIYYTKPFYTEMNKGYKLQMTVHINTKSISCFIFLMKGENDKCLEWPFRADVVVQLVSNKDATKYLSKIISFTPGVPNASCSQVTESNPCAGFGLSEFVLLSNLSLDYTHGDFLTFRISKIHVYSNGLVKKVPRWQGRQQVNFMEFNITGYSLHKELGTKFLSPPFYTHTNGYKMRLEVDFPTKSNGYISLFARLLKGEYDTVLEWPFTCNLLVELLNWKVNRSHHSYKIGFHERIPNAVNSQVLEGCAASLCYGKYEFVSEKELMKRTSDVEYVQQDCLRLQIKKIAAYSKTEKRPYWQYRFPSSNYVFTVGDFTKRMELNNCFLSPPFFAFPQGYKMCLKIYPNGLGSANHVSVYVCLLQGEYDDFLQWPFEGDIVIDIINWKEDKGHFRKVISLSKDVPESYREKVDSYVEIPNGWGFSEFISHHLLFSSQKQNSNAIYVEENKHVQFMVRAVINKKNSLICKSPKWKGWLNSTRSVCEFTLTNYSQYKEYGIDYYSPNFYTHKNGYKMQILVESSGSGNFKGTSLSLYVWLLRGEFDDSLKWPMNVEVPVEILNWKKNAFHILKTVTFGEASLDCKVRIPANKKMAEKYWGFYNFCENTTLSKCTKDIQYIDEDCLRFRVKEPIIHSRKGIFS